MGILSADDRAHLAARGYVVVGGLVPGEMLDAVVDAIYGFLEMDRQDPETWYRESLPAAGIVQLFQHPSLWAIRQLPSLYELFVEITGRLDLWVSIDRVNMKPPARADRPSTGDQALALHWDRDPRIVRDPIGVQGVVALTDTPAGQGGFWCSPDLFSRIDDFLAATDPANDVRSRADGRPKGPADLSGFEPVFVPMNAGDIVVWNCRLPHGNGPNLGRSPRLAQYIKMEPAGSEEERRGRVADFDARRGPGGLRRHATSVEREVGPAPELSPLGRRLLGLDRWSSE